MKAEASHHGHDCDPRALEEDVLDRILMAHADDDDDEDVFGLSGEGMGASALPSASALSESEDQCLISLISDDRYAALSQRWRSEVVVGLQILDARQRADNTVMPGRTQHPPWEPSLVACSCRTADGFDRPCVEFVFWTQPSARKGRILTVSDTEPHYVSWPAAGSHPEQSFYNAEVVHPAVGIHVKRVAARSILSDTRSSVPPKVMRLKLMWEAAQAARTGNGVLDEECELCHSEGGTLNPNSSQQTARQQQWGHRWSEWADGGVGS